MKGTANKNLAAKHQRLVEDLKVELLKGISRGFLGIGEVLYKIKKGKTYKAENEQYSFSQFCRETKTPLPGNSPESKRLIVLKLIKIYEAFILGDKIPEEKIIRLGYVKSYKILSLRQPRPSLLKLAELAGKMERSEIKQGFWLGPCKHERTVHITKCLDCGKILKTAEM